MIAITEDKKLLLEKISEYVFISNSDRIVLETDVGKFKEYETFEEMSEGQAIRC